MLRDAARHVPLAALNDYLVVIDFEGFGHRTLSHAEGLRASLRQAAAELEGLPDRLQGYWRIERTAGGRPGERLNPKIRGVSIIRVSDRVKKPKKRKKRRKS